MGKQPDIWNDWLGKEDNTRGRGGGRGSVGGGGCFLLIVLLIILGFLEALGFL